MFYYHKGLTRAARRTVATAITIAGRQGCTAVDTGHLLLAMLQTGRGTAVEFLRRKQITVTALSACASQRACTGRPLHLRGRDLAPESRKALEFAVLGAHAARVNKAENEHLLCAMLEDTACTASVWLAGLGLEVPRAARECRQLSGQLVLPSSPRMSSTRGSRPSEKYGRDLTRLAQEGQLDPVLCRDDELERMIEILCRRQKNNPCLLGEPGVGKSALAEALAQRIAAGQVTPSLKGKRVLALDMASMVAGTKYRGDFEERFKNLLEELYRDRSTILFIDEIHVIAGAGAAEGAIDAASILKPMLARGEIQLIGATTPEEYRKTIQKDSALDRRFGMVNIEEPAPQQAEKILTGLMPRYERYHGVRIPQEAIRAAVELSVRYLPGRYLPDKAIDLLDEAAAALRISGGEQSMLPGSKMPVLTSAEIAKVVGKASGVPREDGFEITVASEIMAVLCLSSDLADLKARLAKMVVAYTYDDQPVTAHDLKAEGAMAALLKDAIKPNLVQTLEGTPAFIHGGPFANIAHGCNSLQATETAMRLSDYTVTEAGFAADLGAEKFLDIKCRAAGFHPNAVVIVATVRALKYHGGVPKAELNNENLEALEKGLPNLLQHVDNVKNVYGLPCVVAVNAFPTDTAAELALVESKCRELGVNVRLSEVWAKGGEGGKALAEEVVRLCEEPDHFQYVYDVNDSIEVKLNAIATKVYHADGVIISAPAKKQLKQLTDLGFDNLPICMAKTQFSFSDDAGKLGAPRGFKITVRDLKVNAGAGFLVAKTGDIMTMPGLPKVPSAEKIDVDENGRITGLF